MSKPLSVHNCVYAILLSATLAAASPVPAFAQEVHQFTVQTADPLQAIQDFGAQSGLQILASATQLRGKQLNAVNGVISSDIGLTQLLEGTGLRHKYVAERTVVLVNGVSEQTSDAGSDASSSSVADERNDNPASDKTGFWNRLRLAQSASPRTEESNDGSSSASASTGDSKVEEIVVSAQKRGDERLQDVPIPISVLNTQQLASSSRALIRDYFDSVPGINMVANYGFTQNLSIRGITTGGFSNPIVGVLIDEIPVGFPTNSPSGQQLPDVDPGDLERIEVLRGPQGTLYGANSMGGLIKYVTKAPSFDGLKGSVEAGTSSVHNGDDLGYQFRGAVNVPLGSDFAVRASAFARRDPGYIGNSRLGADGVNDGETSGVKLSTLWRASENVSLKLAALYQHAIGFGVSDAFELPGYADLDQDYMPGSGRSDRKIQAYSATLDAHLGFVDLTSITGYNKSVIHNDYDRTGGLGGLLGPTATSLYGVAGVFLDDNYGQDRVTQEVRFSGHLGSNIDWMIGGFYSDAHGTAGNHFMAADVTTGQIAGPTWFRDTTGIDIREYAAFASGTYRFTDRFDVQIGGREGWIKERDREFIQSGPFIGAAPRITPPLSSSASAFTYLVTPRYRISPNVMVYARLASGYRPGGPNTVVAAGVPREYAPDKTQNYEIGAKGDLFNGVLSIDASVFYIDWQDIQIQLRDASANVFQTNGSRAKSQGVELSASVHPSDSLRISSWVAFTDAVLTENFPTNSPAYGVAGDRLANSPRFSGNLSIEQGFPLWSGAQGYVGGSVTYAGDRMSVFTATPVRTIYPAYTKADLTAGIRSAAWSATFYLSNVTDERGKIGGGLGYQPSYAFAYIQPRTLGVTVARDF